MHFLFFHKVCQFIALMSVQFNGIISGFKIFVLHIHIFRVKKVVPTDGPVQVPAQVTQDYRILENLYEACSDIFRAFSLLDHHAKTLQA